MNDEKGTRYGIETAPLAPWFDVECSMFDVRCSVQLMHKHRFILPTPERTSNIQHSTSNIEGISDFPFQHVHRKELICPSILPPFHPSILPGGFIDGTE
jgi:hypothetical protein